jgi:2'-5' RNA ligase
MQQAIQPINAVLSETYKKQLAANEYQLILSPHEELANKIRQIRTAFNETYQVTPALSGKPNLTLLRFTQLALMEERIVQRLRAIAMGFCPFKIELKDFGSLPTHSIFIQVTSKLPIRNLVKEVRDAQRLMKLDKEHKPHFIDEPNLLVARNLLPWQYEKGWLEYAGKSFTGIFIADGMLLLRRTAGSASGMPGEMKNATPHWLGYSDRPSPGTRNTLASGPWQIVERFAFQNLPVTTRQGELFA